MKNRNKIVIAGLSVLAVASVTSVGLASWLVGFQQKEDVSNLTVKVDDTKDRTIILDATVSYPIEGLNYLLIAEQEACDTGIVVSTNAYDTSASSTSSWGWHKDALKFTIDLSLTVGNAYVTGETGSETINDSMIEAIDLVGTFGTSNTVTRVWNPTTNETTSVDSQYVKYVEANPRVEAAELNFDKKSGDHFVFTASVDMAVTWSSFFGNEAPSKYYNDAATEWTSGTGAGKDADAATKLAYQNKVLGELKAMQTALNTENTFVITATLDETIGA